MHDGRGPVGRCTAAQHGGEHGGRLVHVQYERRVRAQQPLPVAAVRPGCQCACPRSDLAAAKACDAASLSGAKRSMPFHWPERAAPWLRGSSGGTRAGTRPVHGLSDCVDEHGRQRRARRPRAVGSRERHGCAAARRSTTPHSIDSSANHWSRCWKRLGRTRRHSDKAFRHTALMSREAHREVAEARVGDRGACASSRARCGPLPQRDPSLQRPLPPACAAAAASSAGLSALTQYSS